MYDSALHPLTPARCLADLKWLLQSKPLLSLQKDRFSAVVQSYNALQKQHIVAWLSQVDTEHLYRTILHTVPKKNVAIRLGRYAETLLLYFLQHSKLFELIAANVPLRSKTIEDSHKDHTTIGEIDYLLRDTNGLYWHWELAIKFYLYYPRQDSLSNKALIVANDFKGPAGVDTLALKLNKMFDKQLYHQPPPPYNPDLSKIWCAAAYTRGYLFYPFYLYSQINFSDIYACDALNPHHGRGWWLTIDQFAITNNIGDYFVHLPRLHWLAPFNSGDFLSNASTINDSNNSSNNYSNNSSNIETNINIKININTENTNIEKNRVLSKIQIITDLRHLWHNADIQAGQLVAQIVQENGCWIEKSRGFIMPTTLL
ncbi:MAG: hypothetical protein RL344_1376 [Pseudomonadota bacterium]|jgi:hypothetical protein